MAYTFNLFNFFQQPNTGRFPTPTEAQNNLEFIFSGGVGGNGASGTVADFNWYFPYALEIIPASVIAARGAAYELVLLSDTLIPPEFVSTLGQGLHWGQVTCNVYGDFLGNQDSSSISSSFWGDFQPLYFESGAQQVFISGDFLGIIKDTSAINSIVTGNIPADNLDSSICQLTFSGDFWPDFNFSQVNVQNSGNIVNSNVDKGVITFSYYGDFYQLLSDNSNLQYVFSSYSAQTGIYIQYLEADIIEDNSNIGYRFNNYSRGG